MRVGFVNGAVCVEACLILRLVSLIDYELLRKGNERGHTRRD